LTNPDASRQIYYNEPDRYRFQSGGGVDPDLEDQLLPEAQFGGVMSHAALQKMNQEDEDPEVVLPEFESDLSDLMITDEDLKFLNHRQSGYDNPYECKGDGCLGRSYNAYDLLVGQQFPAEDFPSEANRKQALDLASLDPSQYQYIKQEDQFYKDGQPVGANTDAWIRKHPYFYQDNIRYDGRSSGYYDFTADSWDIHGIIKDKGGNNIFTVQDSDWDEGENGGLSGYHIKRGKSLADLNESEKKALYAKMTPGTIVGFTGNPGKRGFNAEKGLGTSTHSAQVVGWDKDGVPILYDWGVYRRIDDDENTPTYGNMSTLSNISVPKELEGRTLEWAKGKGYYSGDAVYEKLDVDVEPMYSVGDAGELKPFSESFAKNKSRLMNRLGMSGKEYDMMAKLLIAISMQETTGGNDAMHDVEKNLPFTDTIGLTQLNWNNIENDPKLKKIAEEFGVKSKSDLADPSKAAIASMIYGYRNLQSGRENYEKGKGTITRTYAPPGSAVFDAVTGWGSVKDMLGKGEKYDGYEFETDEGPVVDFFTGSKHVGGIGWDKDLEDIQAQFDEIAPGKYRVYEDEEGNRLVDKKTQGSGYFNKDTGEFERDLSDEEIFIYNWNSPKTLRYGDAQGASSYVKNIKTWLDQLQQGGEITPEHIAQMQETLDNELFNIQGLDLNPAQRMKLENNLISTYNNSVPKKFRKGGSKLSPELTLYKEYILGNDESDKARKNYDKLNRVHYRLAKTKNMSAPNFIMTELIA
jgi:hypothetical protein